MSYDPVRGSRGQIMTMLDNDRVAERHVIFWKVILDPGLSEIGEGKQQEQRTVILTVEIRPFS